MCRYIWVLVPPVNFEYTTSCKFYTGVEKKLKIKITFLNILLAAEERCYQHPQPAREFLQESHAMGALHLGKHFTLQPARHLKIHTVAEKR